MVRASARCYVGLLWVLCLLQVDGLIEIVEEQRCQDYPFRLTCRELDGHIAILEAWYTSIDDYRLINTTKPAARLIKTENDSELNNVYVYSSPHHNGIYETVNVSSNVFENVTSNVFENVTSNVFENVTSNAFENVTSNAFENSIADFLNDPDTELNVRDCGVGAFVTSYGSWRERDRRRRVWTSEASINLRAPLSYRCTGVNHCSFVLAEDYPPSVSWSPGVVYIKYACFDDSLSVHYCNREVQVAPSGADSEGYIRTPGYPHFYVGDECRWRLRANPEQTIRVTLMDVSLRSIGPFENKCTDFVTVVDSNGESLLSSCDQVELPLQLTSTTDVIDVTVEARSQGAFPKRGVLLHYKSLGCVTLPAPSDGYLVYRNDDVAHYMCSINMVFADTRQRSRIIWCYDDNRWNDTVPWCVEETAWTVRNDSAAEENDKDTKLAHNEANMVVDIIIPSLLIAALFIGNAFIVLVIYKYRKRKTDDLEDEYNTIPLSVNGNVHSAGNAV